MTDERREYQEMVGTMNLSDEKGEALLGEAKKRLVSHKRKVKRGVIASIVMLLMMAGVGSGVTYAATGKTPYDILRTVFHQMDDEMIKLLGDQFKTSGESVEFKNWKITLERYWFNQDAGRLIAELTWETTDGSELIDQEYVKYLKDNGEPILPENYESMEDYLQATKATNHFDVMYGGGVCWPEIKVENLSKATLYFNCEAYNADELQDDDAVMEVWAVIKGVSYETEFSIENTGEWKQRKLDASYVKNSESITIDATMLHIVSIETETWEDVTKGRYKQVEIQMNDGTVLSYGETNSYYTDKIEQDNSYKVDCRVYFDDDYLNVDKVVSVKIDGVEVPFVE